jgi:hypothetical protein
MERSLTQTSLRKSDSGSIIDAEARKGWGVYMNLMNITKGLLDASVATIN